MPGGTTPDHGGNGRGSFAENRNPNSNGNVGNLAAMKRIMRRKCAMAQDTWREMGSSWSSSISGDVTTTSQRGPPTTSKSSLDRGRGEGGDDDCWAMMGNHMEEETMMDREEEGNSAFSI
jgi:hypothetical protein